MGVLDKWLRGVSVPDRGRKPTPSRPSSTIGNTVRNRQVISSTVSRPAVPIKQRSGVPVSSPSASKTPTAAKPTPKTTATPAPEQPAAPAVFDEALQKKLDRYFERLRAVYPNGVISRLNTGQKKLAERGAQLRKMCQMENELDAFFALGGFTYERTAGGRPRNVQNPKAQTAFVDEVRSLFPLGISSAAELDRINHELYLRLRSAARLSGVTITEFLKSNDLTVKGEQTL